MARNRLGDHRSIHCVQRCEQRGRSVPLVVVGHRPTASLLNWMDWLGSVQLLDLTLLIHAQNDGVLGRVQLEGHDIHQRLFKLCIVADVETDDPVRFEPSSFPDATHHAFAHAYSLCHFCAVPVRCFRGLLLSRLLNNLLSLRGNHPRFPPLACLFLLNTLKACCLPSPGTLPGRSMIATQRLPDVAKGFIIGQAKDDLRSWNLSGCQRPAPCHLLQARPLIFGEFISPSMCHLAPQF